MGLLGNNNAKENAMKPLQSDWFLPAVPGKPCGRYAHIIMLRVTD